MKKARKGFTLIEILIVIIIIGILAGMMIVSMSNAADKAEATKIVNNMIVVKTACLLYYADNGKWPEGLNSGENNNNTPASERLSGYIDRDIGADYTLIINSVTGNNKGHKYAGSIFVKYDGLSKVSYGVRKQLAIMAPSANLWNTSSWSDDKETYNEITSYYYHYYYTEKDGNSPKGYNTLHMPVYIVKN